MPLACVHGTDISPQQGKVSGVPWPFKVVSVASKVAETLRRHIHNPHLETISSTQVAPATCMSTAPATARLDDGRVTSDVGKQRRRGSLTSRSLWKVNMTKVLAANISFTCNHAPRLTPHASRPTHTLRGGRVSKMLNTVQGLKAKDLSQGGESAHGM